LNHSKENHRIPEFPGHEDLLQDPFSSAASPNYTHMPYAPYYQIPKKRKWVAGVLSLIIPGTGHFYLGLMQRGLFIMTLIILDIFTITMLVSQDHRSNVPMVTLFALILPVIYFYNVFDALQATDNVNRRNELGDFAQGQDPLQKLFRGSNLGVMLITIGVLFFLLSSKPDWFTGLFSFMGSYIGSVVLIVAGLAMFLLESRKNKSE
jgi:hypothetical protein